MSKTLATGFFFICLMFSVKSQVVEGLITQAIIVNGDTVPIYIMKDVRIYSPVVIKTKHEAIKFSKLVRNVKKVYPYARITGIKVKEMNTIVQNAATEKERKKLMKEYEDNLKAQFEEEIKNLTFSQGILLIKLIDRETGQTSFDIIKEFRGKIMASFYQTLGVLFGYNLKTTYDPEGEDKEIEKIVQMIENGAL